MSFLHIYFIMVAVMMTIFLVTGGMRLGFGMWYLFIPRDERPYLMDAMQPHVDGSSLWIVLSASALYFLFPRIYRVLFVGFYPVIAVIFIVMGLRIIALALRKKVDAWHFGSLWDVFISLGNLLPLFLLGLIAGYILKGAPLYDVGRFNVNVIGYLSHYTLVSGLILACAAAAISFAAIGWNTDGRIRSHARKWAFYSSLLIIVLIFDLSLWSLLLSPYISESMRSHPILMTVPAITFIASCTFPVLIYKRRFGAAFIVGIIIMVGLAATFFLSIYPHLRLIFLRTNPDMPRIPGIPRELRPRIRMRELVQERQILLPVYLLLMSLTALLQARMYRLHHHFTHCPLPHDERDEELF